MKTFKKTFLQYDWDWIKDKIYTTTEQQVESVLNKRKERLKIFWYCFLLRPLYLEKMAQITKNLTQRDLVKSYKCMPHFT